MALVRRRISASTSAAATPNTRLATVVWRSSPLRKASMRPPSSERWAMIRISIWL